MVTSNLGNKFKSGKYYKIHLQSTLLLHKLACGARCLKLCQKKAEEILNLYRWRGDLFSNSLQKWWFSFYNIVKTNFWRLRVSPNKQLIRLNWYTHMIYSTDSSKYNVTYIHNSTEQIIARTNCKFFPTIIYFVRTKTFIYFVRINMRIYFFWNKRH